MRERERLSERESERGGERERERLDKLPYLFQCCNYYIEIIHIVLWLVIIINPQLNC